MKTVFRKNLNAGLFLMGAVASTFCTAEDNEYRWENSQGVPVFSDRPPEDGSDFEMMDKPGITPGVFEDEDEDDAAADAGLSDDDNLGAVKGKGVADSKKNPAMCEKARMNLLALEQQPTLKIRNEQGEVKVMSPEDRDIAKQNALDQIERYCE